MSLVRLSDLLGSAIQMPTIAPPGPSLDDWERYLREVADVLAFGPAGDPSIFFPMLRERMKWLRRARERNWEYEYAEQVWNAAYERDRAALLASQKELDRRRSAAMRETTGPRRGRGKPPADAAMFDRVDEGAAAYESFPDEGPPVRNELFDYANDRIK